VIAAGELRSRPNEIAERPAQARAVLALARVEGRRLITHPAVIVTVALAIVQTLPFLLSRDATREHDVGWLLQVSALLISFGAFLAADLLVLKSRRDGSEELFQAAPLPPARRTLGWALAAAWVMTLVALLLLAGDLAIRAAGKGAATDTGRMLFPLFDLVQGPVVTGFLVLVGIAVARWFPRPLAGPLAVVGLFVGFNFISNSAKDVAWFRLTPFDPTFLNDGGTLAALHVAYLGGLGTVVLAGALLRSGGARGVRIWLAGGLAVAAVSGAFQLAS